jgi:hypothetical protein
MMDSLLRSPHGRLAEYGEQHEGVLAADPDFYGRMGAWYQDRGVIRDQRQLFVAHMGTSPHREHREAAFVMLQALRTFEVARLVRYLKETRHRLPRRTRSAVRYWLRRREAWPEWLDEVALRDKKNLKYLYATLHVKPNERARAILFDKRPPVDSRVALVRRLAQLDDSAEVARQIVEHRIFSSTAVGLLKKLDGPSLAALVAVMSPQQLINSLAALRRRGALQHPRVRRLVEAKLDQARTESRVQDARTLRAAAACGDTGVSEKLGEIATERLRRRGRIQRPTALFVDKSGSMQEAIEVGCHLAALCSTIADADLRVLAFDSVGREVRPPRRRDPTLHDWHTAFASLSANGATSIGAPFVNLTRARARVEQIVVITDGAENTAPFFTRALREYEETLHTSCSVVVVFVQESIPGRTSLQTALEREQIPHSIYRFEGDLYSLPNLVPYLVQPCRAELGAEILETPLPTLDDLERLPPGFSPETCELL